MKSWLKHAQPLALATAFAVAFGACDEQLDSGIACPALCPQQQTTVRDTTFFAVDLDTAIAGYPSLGQELRFFITSMGETLQTRAVVRYDSLPSTFRHTNSVTDSAIIAVDTGAHISLTIVTGDTLAAPTTVEVYDVDMNGAEEADPSAVAAVFTPDRLLGSRTIPGDSLRGSLPLRMPIDPAKLLAKIQATAPANRLRIGIRVATAGTTRLTALTSNTNAPPLLVFRPDTSATVPITTMVPLSKTPAEAFLASDLADYLVIAKPPPDPPANVFRVGGLPGRRAYLRFSIPSQILDSGSVVRATLMLTQRPNGLSPDSKDTVAIQPYLVAASAKVPDISRALLLLTGFCSMDSVRLVPADTGARTFEVIAAVRCWRGTKPGESPRALALTSTSEGGVPRLIDFFSLEAPIEVRPRLRITYLPKKEAGLP